MRTNPKKPKNAAAGDDENGGLRRGENFSGTEAESRIEKQHPR
jgi:hypothetical protein